MSAPSVSLLPRIARSEKHTAICGFVTRACATCEPSATGPSQALLSLPHGPHPPSVHTYPNTTHRSEHLHRPAYTCIACRQAHTLITFNCPCTQHTHTHTRSLMLHTLTLCPPPQRHMRTHAVHLPYTQRATHIKPSTARCSAYFYTDYAHTQHPGTYPHSGTLCAHTNTHLTCTHVSAHSLVNLH